MNRWMLAAVAVVAVYAGSAGAQNAMPSPSPAPSPPQRLDGTVATVTDKSLTVTGKDGTNTAVDILPVATVTVVTPITLDQIQAGSYVATANKTQADGTGVSIEIRVFPPDTRRFDVNRAMDQTGETIMTNGSVATAVTTPAGRQLTVDYGSGKRTVTVPAGIPISLNTPGTLAMVHVGDHVMVTTGQGPGGVARQQIRIIKTDAPK